MKAIFTVEVEDSWVHRRWVESWADPDVRAADEAASPDSFFGELASAIAEDDLRVAFFSWPVKVSVVVE